MNARRWVWIALGLGSILVSCGSASYAVDGARAHARVVKQVAFGPRVPGTPGHRAIQGWLVSELERLGGRVERQTFTDSLLGTSVELTNLIARFGPATGRRVALTAHYDTRAWADQDADVAHRGEPVPGANDGGSGVAVLLEVAELMARQAPPVGVDLVFFDGEDQGREGFPDEYCRGSHGYAARLPADRPVAAFNFDMVGDRDLAIHPEMTSKERASNLVELVQDAAHATHARHFYSSPGPRVFDDHIPLLDAGLPAVDLIDFEYAAWHTHRDLPDQVSAASLAEVSKVAAWLVYRSPLARSH
jgi:Peptidase family M28